MCLKVYSRLELSFGQEDAFLKLPSQTLFMLFSSAEAVDVVSVKKCTCLLACLHDSLQILHKRITCILQRFRGSSFLYQSVIKIL